MENRLATSEHNMIILNRAVESILFYFLYILTLKLRNMYVVVNSDQFSGVCNILQLKSLLFTHFLYKKREQPPSLSFKEDLW